MSFNAPHEGVYIRVKRKREDEPATHMLAEINLPGAKKMRESFVPGVFTYAETVEDSSLFDNKQWVDRLNARVTMNQGLAAPPLLTPSGEGPMSLSTTPQTQTSELAPVRRESISSPTKTTNRSYTIVPQKRPPPPPKFSSRPTAPPVVRSANDPAPATPPNVTFYEAIESSETPEQEEPEDDPSMEQFASMVNDYLQLNNIPLSEPKPVPAPVKPQLVSPTRSKSLTAVTGDSEDYVYDVFYFALKDVNDINQLMQQEAAHIATLRGLPLDNFEDLLPDDRSDDSAKDEADEDSNDEDYYRNDYPDEDEAVADSEEEERVESGWRHYRYDD